MAHPLGPCDALSSVSILTGLPTGRINPTPPPLVSIEDLTWLSSTQAIVTWLWVDSGFVTTSRVDVEYERDDPSVGYRGGFTADGDCPRQVEDKVAEAAEERAAEEYDDGPEWERDDGGRDHSAYDREAVEY